MLLRPHPLHLFVTRCMHLYCTTGKLMGIALRTGSGLDLDLPALVWRQVVGIPRMLVWCNCTLLCPKVSGGFQSTGDTESTVTATEVSSPIFDVSFFEVSSAGLLRRLFSQAF